MVNLWESQTKKKQPSVAASRCKFCRSFLQPNKISKDSSSNPGHPLDPGSQDPMDQGKLLDTCVMSCWADVLQMGLRHA